MKQPYNVRIESLALSRRYVANSFSRDKQEYTTKIEDALALGEFRDAKQFARTWAEKTGVPYSVWQGEKRLFTVRSY